MNKLIKVLSKYPNVIVNLPGYTVRFKEGVAFIPEEHIDSLPKSGYEIVTPLVDKESVSPKEEKATDSKPKKKSKAKSKK